MRPCGEQVVTFPGMAAGSACASTFSRLARRSLALRPAHSRGHQFVARFTRRLRTFRLLHARSGCFRLERLPGGPRTHWKAPPLHGAHPLRAFAPFSSEGGFRLAAAVRTRGRMSAVAKTGRSEFPAVAVRSTLKLDAHQPRSTLQSTARSVRRPTTAFECSELELATHTGPTARSKAARGRDRIFRDSRLRTGRSWPRRLAATVAHHRRLPGRSPGHAWAGDLESRATKSPRLEG